MIKVKPEEVGISNDLVNKIESTVTPLVGSRAPGFQIAVAKEGKLAYFKNMGYRNIEACKPMETDTIFRFASMTKPIIGVATMILYEQGCFSLEDPIAKYLPEFSSMKVYNKLADGSVRMSDAKPITIKHLLTHTSGLSYYLHVDAELDPVAEMYRSAGLITDKAREDGTTTEQYVRKIAELPLIAQPGERWYYGEGIAVLGRLLEVVSEQSLGNFFTKHLFNPLNMVDTGFFVPPEKIDRLAVLYTTSSEKGELVPTASQFGNFGRPSVFESGSSGLVGTGTDYLRFAQMLANGGELEGTRILKSSTIDLMMSDHIGSKLAETGFIGETLYLGIGMGFGFTGSVVTDNATLGQPGSNGEFSWGGGAGTYFWVDRSQNLVGMLLSQYAPAVELLSIQKKLHELTYQAIVDNPDANRINVA